MKTYTNHGSRTRYNQGCRCQPCKDACNAYQRHSVPSRAAKLRRQFAYDWMMANEPARYRTLILKFPRSQAITASRVYIQCNHPDAYAEIVSRAHAQATLERGV